MQSIQSRLAQQVMLSDTYELHFRSDRKSFSADMHYHSFAELHYVTRGKTYVQIQDIAFDARPGDFFFYPPNRLHNNVHKAGDDPYERYVMWINLEYLRSLSTKESNLFDFFLSQKHPIVRFDSAEQKIVREQFDKIQRFQFDTQFGTDLLKNVYITELLVTIARLIQQRGSTVNTSFIQKNDLLSLVYTYIQDHISQPISISELADHVFLSRSRFCSQFKSITGITIHQFITCQRLMHARDIVLDGGSLTEAYTQCGFGDYSSLYRAFKAEFGLSPREYFTKQHLEP